MAVPVPRGKNDSIHTTPVEEHVISLPAEEDRVEGEKIIVHFATLGGAAGSSGWPQGWTILGEGGLGGGSGIYSVIAERVIDGTEGDTITVTTPGSYRSCHFSISGPFGKIFTQSTPPTANNATIVYPKVEVPRGDYLVLGCAAQSASSSISTPDGYTQEALQFTSGDAVSQGVFSAELEDIEEEQPGESTASSSGRWAAFTVAIAAPGDPDETPPSYSVAPDVDDVTHDSVTCSATAADDNDLSVNHYAVAVSDGASPPSAEQIEAGQDANGDPAVAAGSDTSVQNNTKAEITLTGLSPETAYDIYWTCRDSSGNYATPVKIDVTTLEEEEVEPPPVDPPPVIDSVGDGEVIEDGDSGITITGENFGESNANRVFYLVQGEVAIEQDETGQGDDESATIDPVLVDDDGTALKYGPAQLVIVRDDDEQASIAVNVVPPEGQFYVNIGSLAPFSQRIKATPDLETGDQLHIRGSDEGAAPVELTVNPDGTVEWSTEPGSFEARAWDHNDSTWGPFALIGEVFDIDPPVFDSEPALVGVTNSTVSATASATDAEDASVNHYAVLVLKGSGQPSAEQVKDGLNASGQSALRSARRTNIDNGVPVVIEFTNLTAGTEYEVYWVADDHSGNLTTVYKVEATTEGPSPPVFDKAPFMVAVTQTSATVGAAGEDDEDESLNHYAVAVAKGAAAPTASQIRDGLDASNQQAISAGQKLDVPNLAEAQITLTGLAAETEYDIYWTMSDLSGSLTEPLFVTIKTLAFSGGGSAPSLLTAWVRSGTTGRKILFQAESAGLTDFVVHRSRNGSPPVQMNNPIVTELSPTTMPGWYALTLNEDTTIDEGNVTEQMLIRITHEESAPVEIMVTLFDRIPVDIVKVNGEDTGVITGQVGQSQSTLTSVSTNLTGFGTNQLVGRRIIILSGPAAGEAREIRAYNPIGGVITFEALTTPMQPGDRFKVV